MRSVLKLGLCALLGLVACSQATPVRQAFGKPAATTVCPKVPAVSTFSVPAYMGHWYEIATNTGFREIFENNLFCNSANYTLEASLGQVKVDNYGFEGAPNGPLTQAIGKAVQVKGGALKVAFFGDFFAPYDVIDLIGNPAQGYQVAIVYSCNEVLGLFKNQDLWILSRTPTLPPSISLSSLLDKAKAQGIDVKALNMTKTYQGAGCVYLK